MDLEEIHSQDFGKFIVKKKKNITLKFKNININ